MKWRYLGHLQLLSRAVALMTGMAEMEVSPQEKMANPQSMKMFAVERHGIPEDFTYFRALCADSADCLGSAPVVGTGRDSVHQVCVLLG